MFKDTKRTSLCAMLAENSETGKIMTVYKT